MAKIFYLEVPDNYNTEKLKTYMLEKLLVHASEVKSEPTPTSAEPPELTEVIYAQDTGLLVTAFDVPSTTEDKFVNGHMYRIATKEVMYAQLNFQNGPIPVSGVNGVTNETVLAVLIHRTETLNALFPSIENETAIAGMKDALQAFEERTRKRRDRGVEGTLQV